MIKLLKASVCFIGEQAEFSKSKSWDSEKIFFVYYIQEYQRIASDADLSPYSLMPGYKKLYFSTTKYGSRS